MILDTIVADKKNRLKEQKNLIQMKEMINLGEATKTRCKDSFYQALKKPQISIIGECKKASPSLGKIESQIDITTRIAEYNDAADCISCLTEEDHFLGCAKDLIQIRKLTDLPILRKDFVIDPYQIYEAKYIGADAILLIAAILDDAQLADYYQLAQSLELDVLVEVHDEQEMERALKINPRIIGVNNRNLKDFHISLDNTKRLRHYVPEDKVFISESGILNDDDIIELKNCHVDGFLIGRAFMESANPKELALHWKGL